MNKLSKILFSITFICIIGQEVTSILALKQVKELQIQILDNKVEMNAHINQLYKNDSIIGLQFGWVGTRGTKCPY